MPLENLRPSKARAFSLRKHLRNLPHAFFGSRSSNSALTTNFTWAVASGTTTIHQKAPCTTIWEIALASDFPKLETSQTTDTTQTSQVLSLAACARQQLAGRPEYTDRALNLNP